MRIGELSKRSGFSRDTIRYYEKMGLIRLQDEFRSRHELKDYPETVVRRLLTIRKIKDFGFTLQETLGIMNLFEEGVLEPERGIRYVRRKIDRLDQQIRHMVTIRGRLQQIVDGSCSGHCPLDEVLHSLQA
jgi:MerR family transcriptional regulator, copper efflux regulator